MKSSISDMYFCLSSVEQSKTNLHSSEPVVKMETCLHDALQKSPSLCCVPYTLHAKMNLSAWTKMSVVCKCLRLQRHLFLGELFTSNPSDLFRSGTEKLPHRRIYHWLIGSCILLIKNKYILNPIKTLRTCNPK